MLTREFGVGQLDEGLQGPAVAFVCQVITSFFFLPLSLFPVNGFVYLVTTVKSFLCLIRLFDGETFYLILIPRN